MKRRDFLQRIAVVLGWLSLLRFPSLSRPRRHLIPRRRTPDGWTVAKLHWSQVPGYDIAAASAGMTDAAVQQECEIDWSGHHEAT